MKNRNWLLLTLVGAVALSGPLAAQAADRSVGDMWTLAMNEEGHASMPEKMAKAPDAPDGEWQKPVPVSVWFSWTLVSDYVWRGLNFSDAPGEDEDWPNHQLDTGLEVGLGRYGAIGFDIWMEFYEGQHKLGDPDSGHLQEVDYIVYYTLDISELCATIPVNFTMGWIAYTFPEEYGHADSHYTNELYFVFEVDDSSLFGTENAVLNPYFAWYADMDDFNGNWWEFGLSHEFALAELGMANIPLLRDTSVTPSWVMGVDHNFFKAHDSTTGLEVMEKDTRIHNFLWGVDVTLDLSSAMSLPASWGSLSLSGFLNYSQPISQESRDYLIDDEVFGGMTLGWEW